MYFADKLHLINPNRQTQYVLNWDDPKTGCEVRGSDGNDSVSIINMVWKADGFPDLVTELVANSTGNRYWTFHSLRLTSSNDDLYRYFAYGINDNMYTPMKYSYACSNEDNQSLKASTINK